MTDRLTQQQLDELKVLNPCDQVAAQWVRLRGRGRKKMGPCPICSDDRQAKAPTRFEVTPESWVCAVCSDGGDVIKLVQKVNGWDFLDAVAWLPGGSELLNGRPANGPEVEAELARRAAQRQAEREKRDADAAMFRERERSTLYEIWTHAQELAGSPAEAYLRLRGLTELPPGIRLRCVPSMPYYIAGGDRGEVIARAPAMVAPIIGVDGKFSGLHFTYIDLNEPKGKARILDPETGDPLPAKKVRGTKVRGRIELVRLEDPKRLVMGEGIEKTLAVWLAYLRVGRPLIAAYWSAVDLGNLGGKALETVPHPTLKSKAGRAQRVPGPVPDLEQAGIPIPDSVEDLVTLGDSTSDSFTTRCALERAAERWRRPGRTNRVAWAPADTDFDDLLMREAA